MDPLKNYRNIVGQIVNEYARIVYSHGDMHAVAVLDTTNDRYLVVRMGWDGPRSAYGVIIHLDIIDGKIWIQCDNTDAVVANDLERAGVPKKDIVLGFQPPEVRPLTAYSVA